jgi:hypothetical protein
MMYYDLIPILRAVPNARRVTAYRSTRLVVKATRRHRVDRRSRREEFVVTIGPPNFRERAFIKQCQRAGEPFPVLSKAQIQGWPSRRSA